MKLKLENQSSFFVNFSPEVIVHLVENTVLTCKIMQKIKPVALQNVVAMR